MESVPSASIRATIYTVMNTLYGGMEEPADYAVLNK